MAIHRDRDIDFPEVMEFRSKLFDPRKRETNIGLDANNHD